MYRMNLRTHNPATLRPLCGHDGLEFTKRDDGSLHGSRCDECGATATRGPTDHLPGRSWVFEGPDGAEESAGRLLDQRHAGDRA